MYFERAIIVGHEGQDGRILTQQLISQQCLVLGIGRDSIKTSDGSNSLTNLNSHNPDEVLALVEAFRPQVIFFLAAYHNSSEDQLDSSGDLIRKTYDIALTILVNFLEAIRVASPACRFVFAASSHIFINSQNYPQSETTPYAPNSVYGYAKLNGLYLCRYYRHNIGLRVSTAILFNHESEFRSEKFVSTKLMMGAIRIHKGISKQIEIGNLQAKTDWGYAYDYCDAMYRIAQVEADEFVVATGVLHTVADFAEAAFMNLGLDYRNFVIEKAKKVRNTATFLQGDSTKLRKLTNWKPTVDFRSMVAKIMEKLSTI